jgi:signal transduction histidine kinase/ligand-binding sensor domain-containing protein
MEERGAEVTFRHIELGLTSQTDRPIQVWSLLEDRQGNLWIGTSAGLLRRLLDDRMSLYLGDPSADNQLVRSLLEDRSGRIWVNYQNGLVVFSPLPGQPSLGADNGSNVRKPGHKTMTPLKSRSGGNAQSVNLDVEAGNVQRFTTADGLAGVRIRSLFQSADGHIWVGTTVGLSEYDGERFYNYAGEQGVVGGPINTMAEDGDGNLWIGTDLGGALKVARNGFVGYKRGEGLPHPWITSIFEGQGGELYAISAANLTINRFEGRRFTSIKPNFPEWVVKSGSGRPHLAIQDHLGEWWAPTIGGLYRFAKVNRIEQLARARPKAVYRARDGLASDDVSGVFEDSRGDLWISSSQPSRQTLTRWERATGIFYRYSDRDGLPANQTPSAFCEDHDGNLWIGFLEGGLARYSKRLFALFTTADGVPRGDIMKIYRDQSRRVWVGSTEGGLSRIENGGAEHPRFVTYTTADGLSSSRVHCITEDQWGRLYLGTARGIDRFDPATGRVKHFSTSDGLVGSEVFVAFHDRGGVLWFGTFEGISRLVPEPDRPGLPPSVLIEELRISGVLELISEVGEREVALRKLGPNQNQVQINYFGLNFGPVGALRYQHKLEGLDRDWSIPTTQQTVNYASLAPGSYRFLVRAVNPDGAVGTSPASVTFDILPPVWQRMWFITLVVMLIGSTLLAFDRYRVARMKELKAALTESQKLAGELTAQRAELRQAHHTLELDNAITRILAETATPVEAAPRMLRAICENTGWRIGVIWNVDPQTHTLHCANVWHPPGTAALTFEALTRQQVFLPGEGLPGRVLQKSQAYWITDLMQDENSTRAAAAFDEGFRRAFGFPVLLRGEVIGVLELFSHERREPDDEQIRMMSTIGSDIGQLIERKRAEEALRESETRFRWQAIELPGLHRDGHEIPLEISFGEFSANNQHYFTGIARDITERKRAEEALRRSREERLAELERVRRRIATDLHDDIGSSLTQISILSEVIRQRLNHEDSPVTEPLSMIAGASRELVDSMSDIVWAINPQKDHLHDLTLRMRRFAADSFTARNIRFQLRLPAAPDNQEDVKLGANLRREVFLIFKESVNNIVRHANCTEAVVELSFADGRLRLLITDNGLGFDSGRESDGHGLMSMRDRVRGIGGQFALNSRPGEGTTIRLEVQLDQQQKSFG